MTTVIGRVTVPVSTVTYAPVENAFTPLIADLGNTISSISSTLTINNSSANVTITSPQLTKLNYDLGNLMSLAKNGINGEYLTSSMISQISSLVNFLGSVDGGVNIFAADGSASVQANTWQQVLAYMLGYSALYPDVVASPANSNTSNALNILNVLYGYNPNGSTAPQLNAQLNLNSTFGTSFTDNSWLVNNPSATNWVANSIGTGSILNNIIAGDLAPNDATAVDSATLDLAGVTQGITTTASPSNATNTAFTTAYQNIATVLLNANQTFASDSDSSRDYASNLTSGQITTLNANLGALIALAQAGQLSTSQVANLNLILDSLNSFSSSVAGLGGIQNTATSTSGWTLDAQNNLVGVTNTQFAEWDYYLNSGTISPQLTQELFGNNFGGNNGIPSNFQIPVSPLVSIIQNADLPPVYGGVLLGDINYDVQESPLPNSTLVEFTGALSDLQQNITQLHYFIFNSQIYLNNINTDLSTLLNLAVNGDGHGNYLTAAQLQQLATAVNGAIGSPVRNGSDNSIALVNLAGVATFVVSSQNNNNNNSDLTTLTSILQSIYSNPVNGVITATSGQIAQLESWFSSIYQSLLNTDDGINSTEFQQLQAVFQSLSNVSSVFGSSAAGTQTTGWGTSGYPPTGALSTDPVVDAAQWNAWIQEVAANPSAILGTSASQINPTFNYFLYNNGSQEYSQSAPISILTSTTNSATTQFDSLIQQLQNFVANNPTVDAQTLQNGSTGLNDILEQLQNLAISGDNGNYISYNQALTLNNIFKTVLNYSQQIQLSVSQANSWISNLATTTLLNTADSSSGLISLAGVLTVVPTVATPTSGNNILYDTYKDDIAAQIQTAASTVNSGVTGVLTSGQISQLNLDVGNLIQLATSGKLSTTQINNLNALLQSLSNVSSLADVSGNDSIAFTGSLTSGWTFDSTGALSTAGLNGATTTSVSSSQWQAWMNGVLANPTSLSALFPISALLPSDTIQLTTPGQGGASSTTVATFTVLTSFAQPQALTNTFSVDLSSLQQAITQITNSLNSFNKYNSGLTANEIQSLNSALTALVNLAVQGDGNGNYLTNQQLTQLQQTFSTIPTFSQGTQVAGFVTIAGVPSYIALSTGSGDPNFNALIGEIQSAIMSTLSNPTVVNGQSTYTFTSGALNLIGQALAQLGSDATLVTNSTNFFGFGSAGGDLSAAQLNALDGLLNSLNAVSSSTVVPILPSGAANPLYTTGWGGSTASFLSPNSTTSANQFSAWLQSIIANPNILAPAITASGILPTFTYAGVIQPAVTNIVNNSSITATFNADVLAIQGLINSAISTNSVNSSGLDSAIGTLLGLAENGDGQGNYISIAQAQQVNALIQSLEFKLPGQSLTSINNANNLQYYQNNLYGMDNYYPAWIQSILNYPTNILNPTATYNYSSTPTTGPISFSPIGAVTTQAEYSQLISQMQAIFTAWNSSSNVTGSVASDVTALNTDLQNLVSLAFVGDGNGNFLTSAQAAQVNTIFTQLNSNVTNWQTLVTGTGLTQNNFSSISSTVLGLPALTPPASTAVLTMAGVTTYVPTSSSGFASGSAGATLLATLQANIQTIFEQAASSDAASLSASGVITNLTAQQISDLSKDLGQYIALAQNGDGTGRFMTANQVGDLNQILTSLSGFSSVTGTGTANSTGWNLTTSVANNPSITNAVLSGLSPTQVNNWYAFVLQNPLTLVNSVDSNSILPVGDLLPQFTYTLPGITPATASTSPSTLPANETTYNNAMNAVANELQTIAALYTGPSSTTTPTLIASQITILQNDLAALVNLAQNGYGNGQYLSSADASNLNTLFSSIAQFVPSGWQYSSGNFALSSVASTNTADWIKWFQGGVFSNAQGRSLLTTFNGQPLNLSYASLLANGFIPSLSINLGGVSQTIDYVDVPMSSSVASSYGTAMSGIASILNSVGVGGTLTPAQVTALNQDVGQLISLAENPNDPLDSASAAQVQQLVSSLSAFAAPAGGWTLDSTGALSTTGVNNATTTSVTAVQWSNWVQNVLGNPSQVALGFSQSTVNIAGVNSASFWTVTTANSSQEVTSDYNQLIEDVQLILQQTVAGGNTSFTAGQITSLNQAVGLLLDFSLGDGADGNSLTTGMANSINTLLASISQFSNTTADPASAAYTLGWALDSTGALTTAGVNGATTTSVSAAQWNAWGASVIATPSTLSPLYPSNFLTNQVLAQDGVIQNTQIDIAGVETTVGIATSMSTTNTTQFNTLIQGIVNVVVGLASQGSNPTLTAAQLTAYAAILNNSLSGLLTMANAGQLSQSALNNLNAVLTTLSGFSSTKSDPLGNAFSPGWTTANFASATTPAVTNAQWSSWLSSVVSNKNSLSPLLTSANFAGPFITLNLGGIILSVPYAVTTSSAISAQYQGDVNSIQAILQNSSAPGTTTLTTTQITQLQQYFGDLINLAENGDGQGNLATIQMDQNISLLVNSLNAVGVQIYNVSASNGPYTSYSLAIGSSTTNPDPTLWQAWRNLNLSSNILQSVFNNPVNAANTNTSIQAMVELDYVKLGNDMLGAQLSGLQGALNTTQTVLNTLTGLQNIHNQLVISTKISFSAFFNPSAGLRSANASWTNPVTGVTVSGSSGVGYEAAYEYYASAYFGTAITPQIATPLNNPYILNPSAGMQWLLSAFFAPGGGPAIVYGQTSALNLGYGSAYYHSEQNFITETGANIESAAYKFADGVVSAFTGGKDSGPVQSAPSAAAGTYHGYYIEVPNSLTIPQSILNEYNLAVPSSMYYTQAGAPTNPVTNNNSYPVFYNFPSVGTITAPSGYTLYVTSTTFPAGLPAGFTTPSSQYSGLAKALNVLTQLHNDGYVYSRNAQGQATLTPPTTGSFAGKDPLKALVSSALGGAPEGLQSTLNNLLYDMGVLSAQVSMLSGLAPSTIHDPNSLYSMTKTVYDNLKSTMVTRSGVPITINTPYKLAFSGLANWLLDGYQTGSNTAGQIQQNITFAVTAAQSLNSQQQQQVSNYLFVFEEFEKSAAAVLQQLTQIIQNIAQNIAPQ